MLSFCAGALLTGCAPADKGLHKADYQDLLERRPPAADHAAAPPPIPELQPILAAPPPPSVTQRLVSVSVTDPSVPLRDVLLELARKVDVDLDLDPNISGGLILTARDRPFLEVIERICDLTNLRYSFKNNVLHVEVDGMYHETYHLDLLNSVRTATTDIASSASINTLIQGGGGGGGGGSNASTSAVTSKSTADVWTEVEANVKQILANSNPRAQPIATNNTGSMVSSAVVPPLRASRLTASPLDAADAPAGGAPTPGNSAATPPAAALAQAALTGLAAATSPNYASDAPRAGEAGGQAVAPPAAVQTVASYSLNKQAGMAAETDQGLFRQDPGPGRGAGADRGQGGRGHAE